MQQHIDSLVPEAEGVRPIAASLTFDMTNARHFTNLGDPLFLDAAMRAICGHHAIVPLTSCIMPHGYCEAKESADGGFTVACTSESAHFFLRTSPLRNHASFFFHDTGARNFRVVFLDLVDFLSHAFESDFQPHLVSVTIHGAPKDWTGGVTTCEDSDSDPVPDPV
jgi:hypothetical protein